MLRLIYAARLIPRTFLDICPVVDEKQCAIGYKGMQKISYMDLILSAIIL